MIHVRLPIPAEDILYKGVHLALLPLHFMPVVVLGPAAVSTVARPALGGPAALLQAPGVRLAGSVREAAPAVASPTAHAGARDVIADCVGACK